MTDTFKITIHMVSSLDGFIAKKDNSVAWFETKDNYEQGTDYENVDDFMKTIDCFVMGSRTYELSLSLSKDYGWPYGDIPTFVLTHRDLPLHKDNIKIYSGDLERFVNIRLKPNYKNVWLVGGAMLAAEFIRLKLANEISLSIIPIILGDGTLFLDHIGTEQPLHLKKATAYKTGIVELRYELINQINS